MVMQAGLFQLTTTKIWLAQIKADMNVILCTVAFKDNNSNVSDS